MKYALRIFGILAVVFALYVIVGEQLVGSSGDAYVNTRLAVIRSPSEGVTQLTVGPVGSRIAVGEAIGSIAPRTDNALSLLGAEQARAIYAADLQGNAGQDGTEPAVLLESRIAALDRLIEGKQAEILASQTTALRATASGIIWSVQVYSGESVAAGDTIINVADCQAAFVHASVDQRLYNSLKVGDTAQFRFHDGPVLEATVALMAGTGPRTLLETLAINPTSRILDGYSVLLSAPSLAQDATCPLGRTGRVVFSAGPLSGIGEWFSGLGF